MIQLEEPLPPAAIRQALAPALLQQRASALARLDDFGSGLQPALSNFHAFFGEARLTAYGLGRLTGHALGALVTRLRLVEALRKTPELFTGRLNDPLIIVGLARTGTSYLQQLLSSLPGNRFLTFWEAREPIPDADDDDRIERYRHFAAAASEAEPDLASKHPLDITGPEECMFLLDPSMASLSFSFMDAPSAGYSEWVSEASDGEPYDIYRKLLLYLQSTAPERRFVLKSPAHFGQLSALLRAVPEARLIHTHRDPLQTLPSICSTRKTVMGPALVGLTDAQIGREMLAWYESGIARNAAQREGLGADVNIDLQFEELTLEPRLCIERLHRHFDLEWTEQASAALQVQLTRGQPPQVGRHSYSLEEYGLTAGEVAERLLSYRRRWGFAG